MDIKLGYKGKVVETLQKAVNKRLVRRGSDTRVVVDGELGHKTLAAVNKAAWLLGLERSARKNDRVTKAVYDIVVHPENRTPAQMKRGKKAVAKAGRLKAKHLKESTLQKRALAEATRLIGVMEHGGNNMGKEVSAIIRENGGSGPEPWCGDFVAHCYRVAGSRVVDRRWAAVVLMLVGGVRRTKSPIPGDIIRFDFGTGYDHTGLFVAHNGKDTITTIEGNTGASGAVSDSKTGGDGVYKKIRSKSLVTDYLHVTR